MGKLFHFIAITAILLYLTSCITARRLNYLQSPNNMISDYKDTLPYQDYLLGIGDKLYVNIISTDKETNSLFNGSSNMGSMYQLNSSYTDLFTYSIQTDGTIEFPMIGKIQLAGMTIREATDKLEVAIQPLFKFNTVELRLIGRYFSVIGSGSAGYFPIVREKINIFEALAEAGDISVFGDRANVRIIRETPEGTVVKKFDIRSKEILHSEFFYIQPNDVIYIQTLNEQFFSIQNMPTLMSTTFSTLSFGGFLYQLFVPKTTN